MGYVMELRGVDFGALQEALNAAVIDTSSPLAQALLAAGSSATPVELGVEASDELTELLQNASYFWGSFQYSSSGGDEFRSELETDAGGLFGAECVAHLEERILANVVPQEFPGIGWLSRTEVAEAVVRFDANAPELEEQSSLVRDLRQVFGRAVKHNLDIITLLL